MALGGDLPPWISVSPRDFVLATQAGAQLGHTISEASQRAFENQQRMQMEAKHQEQVQAQQAIENAMTRLAADRLENYRQQESKAAQGRLGIEQAGLGLRGQELEMQGKRTTIEQQRADQQKARDDALERIRQDAENRRLNAPRLAGGRLWNITPNGAVPLTPAPFRNPPRDPVQAALLGADAADLRKQEQALTAREASKPSGLGALLHPGYQSDTDKMKASVDAMRKDIQSKYGTKTRHVYNPETGELTPAGDTQEADPQTGE